MAKRVVKAKKRCCKSRPRCKRCPVVCKRLTARGLATQRADGRFVLAKQIRKKEFKAAKI